MKSKSIKSKSIELKSMELENKEVSKVVKKRKASLVTEVAHGITVSNLAYRIATQLQLSKEMCYEMAVAGLLHDIGKLEVYRYIYQREEQTLGIEAMKYERTHSTIGYTFLAEQQYSDFIRESVLYHHENYDGSGYPSNLVGENIPLGARILRVCDVFAALTMDRPYRKAFSMEIAVELMIEEVKNFDMQIFLTFMKVIHQDGIEEILDKEETIVKIEEGLA